MDQTVLDTAAVPLQGLIDDATTMTDVDVLLARVRAELARFETIKSSMLVLLEDDIARTWVLSSATDTPDVDDWLLRPGETVEGHCAINGIELQLASADLRRPAAEGEPWTHDRPLASAVTDELHELVVLPLVSSRGSHGSWAVQAVASIGDHGISELRAIAAIITMVLEKIAVLHEIDERQSEMAAVNSELAATNTELETVAQMASSELHQPLGQIRNYANRLGSTDESLTERELDYLTRITGASGRMQTLVGDLLTFSRVSTASAPASAVSLNQVVGEALMDLELLISDTGGTVTVDQLPVVDGNSTQLRQLFQNLIGNAIKYRRDDVAPAVVVRLAASSLDLVSVEVEDNGIGFEQKFVDRIFKPFQRLHGRGQFDGSGIGLAVCRRIVERHGGTIDARSEPNEGSVFVVNFPTGAKR